MAKAPAGAAYIDGEVKIPKAPPVEKATVPFKGRYIADGAVAVDGMTESELSVEQEELTQQILAAGAELTPALCARFEQVDQAQTKLANFRARFGGKGRNT